MMTLELVAAYQVALDHTLAALERQIREKSLSPLDALGARQD
jgi:hypothetical protein